MLHASGNILVVDRRNGFDCTIYKSAREAVLDMVNCGNFGNGTWGNAEHRKALVEAIQHVQQIIAKIDKDVTP